MSYFPDMTPYTYRFAYYKNELSVPVFNVGWLSWGKPIVKGVLPEETIKKLEAICETQTTNHTLGIFWCPFCLEGRDRPNKDEKIIWKSAEICLVDDEAGKGFAAPDLVGHYVRAHNYLPPAEFIKALMVGRVFVG